jgi:predicted phage terminase large subunit-like protein
VEGAWRQVITRDQVSRAADLMRREKCRRSLLEFVAVMWHVLEPGRPFKRGWALGAICEHLQAATMGQIRDLVVNCPPGMGKSFLLALLTAYEWGPLGRPWLRYVTASYAHNLTRRDNKRVRAIVTHPSFQEAWGEGAIADGTRCRPGEESCDGCGRTVADHPNLGCLEYRGLMPACLPNPGQQSVDLVATQSTGFRLASSIGGQIMGERGDRKLLDDPNRTDAPDSLAELNAALQFVTEVWGTRDNDPMTSVSILIQQRVHMLDVTGHKTRNGLYDAWLCLPMRFDETRRCQVLVTGFVDRRSAGELLFEERYPVEEVDRLEKEMRSHGGEFAVAGQMQQDPVPRGGGLFKRDWFKILDPWQVPQGGRAVRGWDLAASDGKRSAHTAGSRIRRHPSGLLVVESVVQRQLTPGPRDHWMREVALEDGLAVQQDFPQDPGQAGKSQKASIVSGPFEGMDAVSSLETGDKPSRALPFAIQAENGNVALVRAAWNEAFLVQGEQFTKGAASDMIDATSRAYANILRNRPALLPSPPELVPQAPLMR